MEKAAIQHFVEIALRTASSSNRRNRINVIHFDLVGRFLDEGEFNKVQGHAKCLESCALNRPHNLGLTMDLQAWSQGGLGDAMFEC